jgi:hypothetical protein
MKVFEENNLAKVSLAATAQLAAFLPLQQWLPVWGR